MGMSDKQFETYQETLLGRLETAYEEMQKGNDKEMKKIMDEIKNQLKRP